MRVTAPSLLKCEEETEMHELTPHLVCELIIALGFITATVCCIAMISEIRKG
jgi:hypothetical protein